MGDGLLIWEDDLYAELYLKLFEQAFSHEDTLREVDFIEAVTGLRPPARVLDTCCGQGRHALELARRGYTVTGVDASGYLIEQARRAAATERLDARFRQERLVDLKEHDSYELLLNIASFGWIERDESAASVAHAWSGALVPGGKLVFDTRNREVIVRGPHQLRHLEVEGWTATVERWFDPTSGRLLLVEDWRRLSDNAQFHFEHSVRTFTIAEVRAIMKAAGLRFVTAYGNYDTTVPYALEAPRMVALFEKE